MAPTEQVQTKVPNDVLSILNENAISSRLETLELEDLTRSYPHVAQLRTEGEASITLSCHCELTAALHFIKSTPATYVKIGVSKGLCFLCQKYIEELTKATRIKFLVSSYHGKFHSGWVIPPDSPDAVVIGMKNLVLMEINEIREIVINRRRSDSFPNTHPIDVDEDEMVEGSERWDGEQLVI